VRYQAALRPDFLYSTRLTARILRAVTGTPFHHPDFTKADRTPRSLQASAQFQLHLAEMVFPNREAPLRGGTQGSPAKREGVRLAPRHLLRIDAVGAAVTSLLTALVLAPGLLPTGLPPLALYLMAAVAAGFCLLGTITLFTGRDVARTLRVLACANAAYCVAAAALCFTYRTTLTGWGAAYFAGEIAIVLALAATEMRAVST
jgi:hypothetical protein